MKVSEKPKNAGEFFPLRPVGCNYFSGRENLQNCSVLLHNRFHKKNGCRK